MKTRWQDAYRVGDHVEAFIPYADGQRWTRCIVSAKGKTGHPTVKFVGFQNADYFYVVTRMRDIRLVFS